MGETVETWCCDYQDPLNVRFLLVELPPRQYGQILLVLQGTVRTISRHQSHQSKRPVMGSVCESVSTFPGRTVDGP